MKITIHDTQPTDTREHATLESVRAHERPGLVSLANLAARKLREDRAQKCTVSHCGVSVTVTR